MYQLKYRSNFGAQICFLDRYINGVHSIKYIKNITFGFQLKVIPQLQKQMQTRKLIFEVILLFLTLFHMSKANVLAIWRASKPLIAYDLFTLNAMVNISLQSKQGESIFYHIYDVFGNLQASSEVEQNSKVFTTFVSQQYYAYIFSNSQVPIPFTVKVQFNGIQHYDEQQTVAKSDIGFQTFRFQIVGSCSLEFYFQCQNFGPLEFYAPGSSSPYLINNQTQSPRTTILQATEGIWTIVWRHGITSFAPEAPLYYFLRMSGTIGGGCNVCGGKQYLMGSVNPCAEARVVADLIQVTDGTPATTCIDGMVWDTTALECATDCSNLSRATGMQPGFLSRCACQTGYSWSNHQCQFDCALFPFSNGSNPESSTSCFCVTGFVWDDIQQSCLRECQNIDYSTGLKEDSMEECVCEEEFMWNVNISLCVRNCSSNSPYDELNQNDISACLCLSPFSWNGDQAICKINCSSISSALFIDGVDDECECEENYVWNTATSVCEVDCSAITFADGLENDSIVRCACIAGFVWNDEVSLCQKNCSAISFADGLEEDSVQICACINNFIWDADDEVCLFNCEAVEYGDGLRPGFRDECSCVQDFYWNSQICLRNCSAISYTDGLADDSVSVCTCVANFTWNDDQNICERDCAALSNTQGLQNSSVDVCACEEHFAWAEVASNTFKCALNCSSIFYAEESLSPDVTSCTCELSFIWDADLIACTLNCSTVQFALDLSSLSIDICDCKGGYTWDVDTQACHFSCNEQPHAFGEEGTIDCSCEEGFDWDANTLSCQIDCKRLKRTTGKRVEGDTFECECEGKSKWNTETQQCEQYIEAMMGLVIGVTVISFGVMVGTSLKEFSSAFVRVPQVEALPATVSVPNAQIA